MAKSIPYELYDLIPSQATMYLMVKYSFKKQICQIPTSFDTEMPFDFDLLDKAFDIEIQRNESLRNRFTVVNKELKQYFIPSFKMKAEKKYFRTKAEQDAFFEKDAKTPVKFKDSIPYRIFFFKNAEGTNGIYINCSHLAMDAMGIMVFFIDLLSVYASLKKGTDLPAPMASYEEYIKEEFARLGDEKKQNKHAKFYKEYFEKGGEPFYAAVHGPEFLEKTRLKKKDPALRVPPAYNPLYSNCNMITRHIGAETTNEIFNFCKKNNIAPESLFMFAFRTHCSAINYRIDDVFMQVTCSKRATVKEKHMSGCLTQPLQLRTIISEDKTFMEALSEYTSTRASLYRHLDYPYIAARDMSRDMYGYSLIQGPACMMFSWIPIPTNLNKEMGFDFKYDFKTYDLGAYFTPLYAICSPDPKDGGININYLYRYKLSTLEQVNALHDDAILTILSGIKNPDITVGELLDGCTK